MRVAKYLLVAATFVGTSPAWALFDAQLLVGKRTGKAENDKDKTSEKLDGTEIQAAAHLDPIPLVPVAFGLYAGQQSYEPKGDSFDTVTGLEVGVQVYAWFPLGIAGLKPYAKLGYPLYSALKADKDSDFGGTKVSVSSILKGSGPHIGVGLAYGIPLLPISLLLEVDLGRQTLKQDEIKVKGLPEGATASTEKQEFTFNSTAILFGVQAGL